MAVSDTEAPRREIDGYSWWRVDWDTGTQFLSSFNKSQPQVHAGRYFFQRIQLTRWAYADGCLNGKPVVKRLVKATGAENYNVLQNNGRIAHQEVDHVHFHMIPKPNAEEGMSIGWPQQKTDFDKLNKLLVEIKAKMWRSFLLLVGGSGEWRLENGRHC